VAKAAPKVRTLFCPKKRILLIFGCVDQLFGVLSHILHGHIFNKERFPGMIRTSYGE
jgi:hypothetical protein